MERKILPHLRQNFALIPIILRRKSDGSLAVNSPEFHLKKGSDNISNGKENVASFATKLRRRPNNSPPQKRRKA
jgi:hypothetical protein